MKRTKNIAASISLGILTTLAGAGGNPDPLVRLIYPPEGVGQVFNFYFSGDASVVVAQGFPGSEVQIYIDRGNGWVLNRRVLGGSNPGPWPFGISSDGGVVGISDFADVDLVLGQGMLTLPRIWEMASGQYALWGHINGACVSGDGLSVALAGWYDDRTEALLWSGGDDLVNLNLERDEPDTRFFPRAMSHDGRVIAGHGQRFEVINDSVSAYVNHAWVYMNGAMIDIPELDFEYQVSSEVTGVSGDGRVVIGLSAESWSKQSDWRDTSWMWTEENGTVEIGDSERFQSVSVTDVSYDASVMFGEALVHGQELTERFLWYPDAGFMLIDELLVRKGIHIEGEYIEFREISDDGTKLMGTTHIDGRSVGLVVTLPEHGDVLSEVKRDGYIRSKLGR